MKIGIIGGSGLDNPEILKNFKEKVVETKYGKTSSSLISGSLEGMDVCLIARHGRSHEITPTNVNYRANIDALKQEGCTHIIATTAVGSLREEIGRGDFVVLDQFIDFTKHRTITFHDDFKKGPVHVSLADPFSEFLREKVNLKAKELGLRYHPKGTVVTIEGPRFSTRAESNVFRSFGADVINMSVAPEATLAREAGIEYCAIAMSTDYDCWKIDEEPVSWDDILEIFKANSDNMINLLIETVKDLGINDEEVIKKNIRTIPNWPKEGIMFRDITTLIQNPRAFNLVIDKFLEQYKDKKVDVVFGIESRGFIFAGPLAQKLGCSFSLLRKPGKLPFDKISEEYELEYGTDSIEVHKDAIKPGQNAVIIDDLIAAGGTAIAACNLVKKLGGEILECSFVVDLVDLGGAKKIEDAGFKTFSLVEFEGE